MGPGGLLWGRGGRRALSRGVAAGAPRSVQPYEAIPRSGRSRWLNLYRFWRSNGFQHFHRLMESNFQRLGPIYRETVGTYDCVNVLLPQDAAQLFQAEGVFPRRMGIEAWSAHRRLRNHKCGVFLLNGEEWRADRVLLNKEVISPEGTRKFLPFLDTVARDFAAAMHRRMERTGRRSLTLDLHRDLFRFTLEASSYALYGERLGLLEEAPDAEAQRFIGAVETMLRTTLPLLFVPPGLVRWLNHRLWREHVAAWDTIFQHGESGISPRTPPTHGPAHRDKDRVGDGVRDGDGDAPGTPSPAPSRCQCRCRCAPSEGCPPQPTSASRASTRSSAWGGPAATRASWPSCCCRPSCPSTPSGPTSPSSPPAASTRCGGRGGPGRDVG
uniref:Cytochrome P450 family 11 subfamily B member 1 n=1 Tax=Anser brachyrhynchus TaxID=132585 RepID=A0A8B9CJH8_9AVES